MEFLDFYINQSGFLRRCADKVVKIYGCGNLREDLVSAGTVAALEQIGRYDEGQGAAVTTFLYPHIVGAMRREAERHLGLPRGEIHKQGEKNGQYQPRIVSLEDAEQGGLQLMSEESVERQACERVSLAYLRAAFGELSFKEREILGGFFGVYGHKKESLAEIGEAFQIKESAALKAKDKALEKLRRVCLDGGLGRWRNIRTAIREAQRDCVSGRGDLGRWMEPTGCEIVE